jgi:hypothetical protein
MLDPLTALSVASSIVQLIDFSSKVIKQTYEIANRGSSRDILKAAELNNDLLELARDLRGQCDSTINKNRHPNDAEKVSLPPNG